MFLSIVYFEISQTENRGPSNKVTENLTAKLQNSNNFLVYPGLALLDVLNN